MLQCWQITSKIFLQIASHQNKRAIYLQIPSRSLIFAPTFKFITLKTIIMKKGVLNILVVLAVFVGFSSCSSDCYTCVLLGVSETLCEEDYPDSDSFQLAVDAFELLGADCTKN